MYEIPLKMNIFMKYIDTIQDGWSDLRAANKYIANIKVKRG